jgi:HEAT repeat protein
MSLHRVFGLGCLLLLVSTTPMTLRGGEVSPPGDAVAASIARLDDADPLVRAQAAAALWAIDGRLRETLPVLVAARRSSADEVRAAAGAVWGRIGAGTRAAMPYFLDSLRQRSSIPQDKIEAAFGPAGLAAVPALIDALETDLDVPASSASGATMNYANSRGQIAASVALAGIGAEAVPTLAAMLKDGQHVAVRTAAARALSQMSGPGHGEGREALPELIAAL